jgi:hypothetical protein
MVLVCAEARRHRGFQVFSTANSCHSSANAFKRVDAAVCEGDARAEQQHLHCAGDQDLAGLGERSDARADMNR